MNTVVEQEPMAEQKKLEVPDDFVGGFRGINPDVRMITVETGPGRYIYSVFHTIMSLVAIYLSFRCNKGFEIGPFLVACCCPYIYVIYILATRGTCGIIEGESKPF